MPAEDPLAAALEKIRLRRSDAAASGWGLASSADIPRLLAAVEALARRHQPVQLYQWHDGGDCGHPEPEDDTSEAWSDWDGEHPSGEGLDGYDDQRICLAAPMGAPVCRPCTELVRAVTGNDTTEVPADECIVRPVLAMHLTTGEGAGGG